MKKLIGILLLSALVMGCIQEQEKSTASESPMITTPVISYNPGKGGESLIHMLPDPESVLVYQGETAHVEMEISVGRKVKEVRIPANQQQLQLDVSKYPPGVYFAILNNQNEVLAREKFVVTR